MSKSAGEFFSIPLVSPLALVNSVSLMSSKDADNQSMVTSVDVCILTEGMDGAILFVKGSNSVCVFKYVNCNNRLGASPNLMLLHYRAHYYFLAVTLIFNGRCVIHLSK